MKSPMNAVAKIAAMNRSNLQPLKCETQQTKKPKLRKKRTEIPAVWGGKWELGCAGLK
jgi:hypothetical protein